MPSRRRAGNKTHSESEPPCRCPIVRTCMHFGAARTRAQSLARGRPKRHRSTAASRKAATHRGSQKHGARKAVGPNSEPGVAEFASIARGTPAFAPVTAAPSPSEALVLAGTPFPGAAQTPLMNMEGSAAASTSGRSVNVLPSLTVDRMSAAVILAAPVSSAVADSISSMARRFDTDDMDPRGQLAQLSKLEERGRNFYHTPACW
mmetsp:Transcript_28089/g.72104  ORF Transcript_28089/g.72104 Transcript_28089/m.72104 type:complete len:205 (+) Transcript_28089:182-796(+)